MSDYGKIVGQKAFLDAWSLVLHDCEEDVLPLQGVEFDPLASLGTQPSETYWHANKQLSTWQMAIWGLRYVIDKLCSPWQCQEGRIVCVPAMFAQTLREKALTDMSRRSAESGDALFLSEGDIICAWWTRHLIRAQMSAASNRIIAINNAFGLRWLLSDDLLPPTHAYVSNAFCMVPAFMRAKDVLTTPLSFVAAAIRKAYMDLSTRGQIKAVMGLDRAAQIRGTIAMFGDPWMHVIVRTN